ncbi:hypothetical protein E4T47_01506 [Aureobasidium subglaciale]|nr:hypothetical protein E4T43_03155 [Aureobasidium subglaciale]KAI5275530.1 hypothetical protein E4T47_01506 [Aureobasidium subglaciale]
MSNIKSKDLTYDKTASQPAFLQRLRDQNTAISASGRQEQPVARAQRAKKAGDDDDDAPMYVVEGSSETLTKAEYEKLTAGDGDGDGEGETDPKAKFGDVKDMVTGELTGEWPKASGALPDEDEVPARMSATVDAGKATKKRKMAKVVGGDENEDAEEATATSKDESKPKKIKKKGKAIKLSFGDEE